MPAYNIKVGDKNYKIELTKTSEDTFTVKVGDKTQEIKLTRNAQSKASFFIIVNDRKYKVNVEKTSRREPFTIKIDDLDFKVQLALPEKKISYAPIVTPSPTVSTRTQKALSVEVGEGAVKAPMTGKIVSVRVRKGDEVKKGQVICVLEAMKMENEITAPKSGKVKEIMVSEGDAVNEDQVLLVIE